MPGPNEGYNDLTLEKLEIAKRLGKIEVELAKFNENFKGHTEHDMIMQKQIMSLVHKHDFMLYGDGNGTPGMKIEMDRIKQREKNRDKGFWAVALAVIALVTKTVVGFFTFKP